MAGKQKSQKKVKKKGGSPSFVPDLNTNLRSILLPPRVTHGRGKEIVSSSLKEGEILDALISCDVSYSTPLVMKVSKGVHQSDLMDDL